MKVVNLIEEEGGIKWQVACNDIKCQHTPISCKY